jgi:hypothetical protein
MNREPLLILLVGIAIMNGLSSPFVFVLVGIMPAWYPQLIPVTPALVFYLSSLICSTLVLLISGVPAALFERLTGRQETDGSSLLVWTAGAVVLSLPSLVTIL